jgi:hypothetical protein
MKPRTIMTKHSKCPETPSIWIPEPGFSKGEKNWNVCNNNINLTA